jgi:hypothetical protein
VPQFQRQATNPAERTRYLERICDLVARLKDERFRPNANPTPLVLTRTTESDRPHQEQLFPVAVRPIVNAAPMRPEAAEPQVPSSAPKADQAVYFAADVAACGIDPNPQRFYEPGYVPALSRMVAHVIATEGPIYADQLVIRIARAHGFQRNGGNIVETVMRVVDSKFPRTKEDGRDLLWPVDQRPVRILPFRTGGDGVRDHGDIPLVELASLAAPLLSRRRSTEEILTHMKDYFRLGRLREATRQRFEAAIDLARETSP